MTTTTSSSSPRTPTHCCATWTQAPWSCSATSGISLGVGYILLGLLSTIAADFVQASPPMLIQAVAGLALLGAFGSSLAGALAPAEERDGVVMTLVASASSLTFLGIGAAFWGLLGGEQIRTWMATKDGGNPMLADDLAAVARDVVAERNLELGKVAHGSSTSTCVRCAASIRQ